MLRQKKENLLHTIGPMRKLLMMASSIIHLFFACRLVISGTCSLFPSSHSIDRPSNIFLSVIARSFYKVRILVICFDILNNIICSIRYIQTGYDTKKTRYCW